MNIICGACPRDGGDCTPDEDVYGKFWTCLQCGNEISPEKMEVLLAVKEKQGKQAQITLPPIPPKPEPGVKKYNFLMRDYYDAYKVQILAEVSQVGERATRERWGIPSPTWVGLKRRWDRPVSKRNRRNGHGRDGGPAAAVLPVFPEFKEEWGDKVKIAWLGAYGEVAGGNRN